MDTFLAFGAGLSFLLAISEFIRKEKEQKFQDSNFGSKTKSTFYKPIGFFFLSLSIVQFHLYLELSSQLKEQLWFAEIHIPFLFFTGPFAYLYFSRLGGLPAKALNLVHFVPGFAAFLLVLPFVLSDPNSKLEYVNVFPPRNIYFQFLFGLLILGTISNLLYPLLLIGKIRKWKTFVQKEEGRAFSPFLALFYASIFVIFLFVIAQIFFMPLFTVAAAGLTLIVCSVFLSASTSPNLIVSFEKTAREAGYNETRLQGLDVDSVIQKMEELMMDKKLYLDEDLTLPLLSDELKIKTHQLSEILNDKMRIGFREYITGFRLEEASKMLREEPQRSVLAVIYAAGFKSKSAFHKLFQEKYGCSPGEYRLSFSKKP
ncbi:AraC family transcriptional regulator [Leptospira selangorensis]|uniref:AraC family transcriptional regulator n=1 Tax=Leptospira selangorensis TaxID=2484982 RepID=UPI0010836210|nr:helix-turn-helix domain-containing protein [Leptospira selangorensis]TGK08260.1 AraC family transcriptional regulator [Leptospira selangorensis]